MAYVYYVVVQVNTEDEREERDVAGLIEGILDDGEVRDFLYNEGADVVTIQAELKGVTPDHVYEEDEDDE